MHTVPDTCFITLLMWCIRKLLNTKARKRSYSRRERDGQKRMGWRFLGHLALEWLTHFQQLTLSLFLHAFGKFQNEEDWDQP